MIGSSSHFFWENTIHVPNHLPVSPLVGETYLGKTSSYEAMDITQLI
jgi:hypothetical protein